LTQKSQKPRVSIVISNYNGEGLLSECLTSLGALSYPDYEIIIVDAYSSDKSVELIRRDFPQVKVISLDSKAGIGVALNIGLKSATGNILVIDFNVDEKPEPDWLSNIVDELLKHPDGSVILSGVRLLYGTASLIDDMGMHYYHPFGVISKICHGKKLTPQMKKEIKEVSYLSTVLMTRSTCERLGPVDESLFFFGEDVEYCLRAKRHGIKCLVVPSAVTWHKVSATPGKNPLVQSYYLNRSILNMVLRYYPWYYLLTGILGFCAFCIGDVFLLFTVTQRILAKSEFSMFQQRKTFRELLAGPMALWWNMREMDKIFKERFSKKILTK
jgi:GT2 family glycosyltransferase